MKRLLSYEFQFVQNIEPRRDLRGNIIEYTPQSRYVGKETTKLHAYGAGTFCRFQISTADWTDILGVYTFFSGEELIYAGQTTNFAQRINQGYGNISPRNCYIGGQETNCRINKAILTEIKNGHNLELYFHPTQDYDRVEEEIISYFHPKLNISKNSGYIQKSSQAKSSSQIQSKMPSGKHYGITDNPTIDYVREYIQSLIFRAKVQGLHELVLQSGKIHKELSMKNAMPTVCRAMHSLSIPCDYVVIRQSPSGQSSKLIIKYLF